MFSKKNWLYVAAVLVGIAGAGVFVLVPHSSTIRMWGMVLVVISACLIKISNAQNSSESQESIGQSVDSHTPPDSATSDGPGLLAWCLGVVAILAVAISYLLLREDALKGGHQAWPADAFAGSALLGAVIWSYLIAKSVIKNR